MGIRFFKRIKILPGVTINLSLKGPSVSVGPRGAKVTIGPKGSRETVGLPGTGISYSRQRSGPVMEGRPGKLLLLGALFIAILVAALLFVGCGRSSEAPSGCSIECVDNVRYLKCGSGVTPMYNNDGSLQSC